MIEAALDAMVDGVAEKVRQRIRASAGKERPVVCPLLDTNAGTCTVYEARPIACRAYGFYVARDEVLGCARIERISRGSADVVWGNHLALEDRLHQFGPVRALHEWLGRSLGHSEAGDGIGVNGGTID